MNYIAENGSIKAIPIARESRGANRDAFFGKQKKHPNYKMIFEISFKRMSFCRNAENETAKSLPESKAILAA
jgi:hypothetical protein